MLLEDIEQQLACNFSNDETILITFSPLIFFGCFNDLFFAEINLQWKRIDDAQAILMMKACHHSVLIPLLIFVIEF